MGLEGQEPTIYERWPTPDVGEICLKLWVLQTKFKSGTTMPTLGMTLQALVSRLEIPNDGALNDGFGDYVLTGPAGRNEGGYLGYWFGKSKTSAALKDLTAFKETTEWRPVTWEPVLRTLYAMTGTVTNERETGTISVAGTSGPTSSAHARTLTVDRYELIPGLPNHPTEVTVREYTSPVPITGIKVERQQPTRVFYNYLGMTNSLDCLHEEVTIPELLSNGSLEPGFGTPDPQELDWSLGQVFPATTPMINWRPHLYDVEYSYRDGIYYLKTFTAKPPLQPRPIRIGDG